MTTIEDVRALLAHSGQVPLSREHALILLDEIDRRDARIPPLEMFVEEFKRLLGEAEAEVAKWRPSCDGVEMLPVT